MIETTLLRQKMIEEIHHIPEDKIRELYNVIHFFRVGVETVNSNSQNNIMAYAGCWEDMPDQEFTDFLHDITERRSAVFLGRNHRETNPL